MTRDARQLNALIASRPNVTRLTYQPRNRLLLLIVGARAMLFPSLAEGFGVPIMQRPSFCPIPALPAPTIIS